MKKGTSIGAQHRFKAGHSTWNKGMKGMHVSPDTEIKDGEHRSQQTEFKAGHIPKNFLPDPKYGPLHQWVSYHLGKPMTCEFCKQDFTTHKIHWANKSHEYKREKSDWIRLCVRCHKQYDMEHRKNLLQEQRT